MPYTSGMTATAFSSDTRARLLWGVVYIHSIIEMYASVSVLWACSSGDAPKLGRILIS